MNQSNAFDGFRHGYPCRTHRCYPSRLEEIRHQNGIPPRRAFWQRVVDEWDEDEAGKPAPNYAAVKLWHFDREPPIAYLACVAKVFGVRFLWLLTGEGEMTEADQQADNDVAGSPSIAWCSGCRNGGRSTSRSNSLQVLGVLPTEIDPDGIGAAGLSLSQYSCLARIPYWLPLLKEVRRRYSSGFRPSKSGKGIDLVTDG